MYLTLAGSRSTDGFNYTLFSVSGTTFNQARGYCVKIRQNLPLLINSAISPRLVFNVINCTSTLCNSTSLRVFVDIHPYGNYSDKTFVTGHGERSLVYNKGQANQRISLHLSPLCHRYMKSHVI
jgi:hypothetical protein